MDGYPGFWCEMQWTLPSGEVRRVVTDENWEVCPVSPYESGRPYQQNRRMSASELYDGRETARTNAWLRGETEGLVSDRAVLSLIETADPAWKLVPQEMPEGREEAALRPTLCGIQRPGLQVFDAGRIISGWVRISLPGIRDAKVRIRYSEELDESGLVARFIANEPADGYYDEYDMAGDPEGETWQPDFSYKAFRFFEITGYPDWIREENVEAVWAHTPLGEEGSFECSDPLLNAMFEACMRTQKNNVLGLVTDCPHREQAQYLADSDLQAETLTGLFGGGRPVLRKVLTDFRDAMLPDGGFPFVAPGSTERPEFNIRIPEWDLHYVSLLWKVHFAYGDEGIVKDCYGTARKLTESLLSQKDAETSLLPKTAHWHISDWPYPTVDQEGPFLTVHNAKFYRALTLMTKLAPIAGCPEDASRYEAAAEMQKAAMQRHLYVPERKQWRDGMGSESFSQGTNALAALCGLMPEEDFEEAVSRLTGEWKSRTVLSLELFRLLFENGHAETAMGWLSRAEYPGWGYMIAQGAKTMWEGFEDIESHSHAWNGYPARLMADYLLGVTASEPGFGRVRISPYFSPQLRYAQGTVITVRGSVRVRWERNRQGSISLFVALPPGVEADVELPASGGSLCLHAGSHCLLMKEGEVFRQ
ncbi:family 78 glycoside hydrolase catalytic domain [Cohnella candidum]|uniref:alpha-L-rhamnosidase n=1 Tax=Cohnella candidum TaxID=2674991 RepID=A0A3G3JXF5_9BACL|nr:family 78 glycoside hydrolase catalytic domain [Cohnella candidum]AYQ72905.1 alpha-L-rhamnosidase [Cohnella candidum]